jgi:hypothetical protein
MVGAVCKDRRLLDGIEHKGKGNQSRRGHGDGIVVCLMLFHRCNRTAHTQIFISDPSPSPAFLLGHPRPQPLPTCAFNGESMFSLFVCLISRTFSVNKQCFSLTITQRTVLSVMTFQRSKQDGVGAGRPTPTGNGLVLTSATLRFSTTSDQGQKYSRPRHPDSTSINKLMTSQKRMQQVQ